MNIPSSGGGCGLHQLARRVATVPWWLVAALLGWAAPAAGTEVTSKQNTGAAQTLAAQLYRKHCAACHGDQGDARTPARANLVPPPRDFTSAAARALPRERMIAVARDGKPGTAMIGWKTRLKPPEVEAVVDYIRETFVQPQTSVAFSRGRTVYMRMCMTCHGAHGQGVAAPAANVLKPPRAFGSAQARAELTRERMIALVARGKPGTAMPSYASQLTKSDIEGAVDFIRAAFMEAAASAPPERAAQSGRDTPADPAAPLPRGLVGNSERGEAFYAANCVACHGANGDGLVARARLVTPRPRNLGDPNVRARLNRPALFAAIAGGTPGTDMPAWDKVLSDQEIADVAEHVYRRFIHASDSATSQRGAR